MIADSESLIVAMIHRRTTDDKVGVRRAGLQALEAVMQLREGGTRSTVSFVVGG